MKIVFGNNGIYKLKDGLISFAEMNTNKSISLPAADRFLAIVQTQGEDGKDYCFSANKSSINLWDFDLKDCSSSHFLDLGEITALVENSGYLIVYIDNPAKYHIFSAHPFELVQEFDTEGEMLSTIAANLQPPKSQTTQIDRIKLRHQGELTKYKLEISTLKRQIHHLGADLEQAEAELVQSKIAIKKLMNELAKNEKVDIEGLNASLTNTILKRRHSVNQIPTLRSSWSIPFLGITINPITEDKED